MKKIFSFDLIKPILFLLFLTTTTFINATSSSSEEKTPNQTLIVKILYIEDFNHTFNEISIKNQLFKILKEPRLGYKNGSYWFKVQLNPSILNEQKLIFEIEGNTINKLEIFGNHKKIASLNNRLNTPNLAIEISHNKNATYYIKVHFQKHAYFPLKVSKKEVFFENEKINYLKNGLFYGFVIMVFIINIVFYFSLKDVTFLTYALFLGLTNIGMTDYDGFMFFWIQPEYRYYISISLHLLVPLGTAIFTSSLLNHHILVPKSKVISGVLFSIAAFFYSLFIFTDDFFYFAIGDLFGLGIFSYYMYLGICELKRQKFAKFSVIGYSLIWVSGLLFVIPLNWGINVFSTPLESVKLGSLFEMIILTYAITYRVKIMQEENQAFRMQIKNYVRSIFDLENKIQQQAQEFSNSSFDKKVDDLSKKHQLTERETDVLLQIANGLNNQQIAEKLFISVNTVKYHTRNLYEKLDIVKRTEITTKLI